MIISEKQIMQLIALAFMYRTELIELRAKKMLNQHGEQTASDISAVLDQITNQQSEKLKEIE
jgi:hypothetical protein